MWDTSYGKEPFDLRLTVLRLLRCLDKIIAVTLIGSLLFGGIYCVKNVLLREKLYTATVTCKVNYTNPPSKSGDYYINYATWQTYVGTQEFLDMVIEAGDLASADSWSTDIHGELRTAISADLPSDIQVPTFTVSCATEGRTELLERAVAAAVTGPWAERLAEVASIEVLDMGAVHPLEDEFVRPVRAFVFGAVLACFFAVILLLLREIGADSVWLPATLRTRYGLPAMGTLQSAELAENIRYAFGEKDGLLRRNAVCAVDAETDPGEVLRALREKEIGNPSQEWTAVPAPALSPETARVLREMDGVLLAVPAGLHAGKPLESALAFFREQDVKITGVLLWDADEWLIRSYYCIPTGSRGGADR